VTILVVDDDVALSRALRRVLISHGFEVEVAEDGAQALACVRARSFEAVVLDVMMPGVFNRFYRSAKARGTPGAGLGLAIVKQIADAHGGSVTVDRAPDGGAILRLRLSTTR